MLVCSESVWSSGSPRPVVDWIKKDGVLPRNSEIRDTTLIIPSVSISDAGVYRCLATNIAGTVFAQVVLQVEGKKL